MMNRSLFFPTSCIDNFFRNPDNIREYALSLDYGTDGSGRWPGVRSEQLSDLNPKMYFNILKKYLNLWFDPVDVLNMEVQADMMFQRVPSMNAGGWIHTDYPSQNVFMIYLNKDEDLRNGTSIYRKTVWDYSDTNDKLWAKERFYKGEITEEESEKRRLEYNEIFFEKTIEFSNVYNRLICFDGHHHHGANGFSMENGEDRLFLICFIRNLKCPQTPMQKSSAIDHEL